MINKRKKFDPFAPKKTKKKAVTIHDLTGGTTYEEMFGSNANF